MIRSSFALSERGSVRAENQDACLCDTSRGLFAVADGLGGLPNGDHASTATLRILASKLSHPAAAPLMDLVHETHAEVRQIGFDLNPLGFGTTLTVVQVREGPLRLQLIHVGDCAAYFCRGGEIELLTAEHTVAASLCANGWDDSDEDLPATAYHTLTQCIGQELFIDPQSVERGLSAGDRVFLLTDGIGKYLSRSCLEGQLRRSDPLDRICQDVTFLVERAGSPDNYSLVAFEV